MIVLSIDPVPAVEAGMTRATLTDGIVKDGRCAGTGATLEAISSLAPSDCKAGFASDGSERLASRVASLRREQAPTFDLTQGGRKTARHTKILAPGHD
jgi:hypothetical protein